ncbi:hypothetical protein EV651_105336 [Kribbella sp. VKM Ac-2571]|uniref:hypothetical protein n=1 Tax=Kribbella sp. VKM Ac-2571 TaxID=2512222 RepID=UPI00105B5D6C|nr:hypothetical protein [Kribbella sp. VKM Ac-2571]TDO64112.1 hypothetical protein EV651_105336 [Kribbella sp. VKM Ac-2571]
MKQTDEVDDLLTRAGARWRADQEAPPEPDLEYMLSGGRKHRRWVPALAAASVAVVAAGVIAVLPNPKTPTAEAPASPVASAPAGAGTPESFAQGNDDLLVKPGDKVRVSGRIIAAPGKTPVFCAPLAETAIGYPPGKEPAPKCPGDFAVQLNGLSMDQVVGARTIKGVRTGYAAVTGIWRDRAIDVQQVSEPIKETPTGLPKLPCAAPAGGWPSKPSNIASAAVQAFLAAHADQVYGPITFYPNGTSRGAPVVMMAGVAHGDLAAFREAFEKVYSGNLCVAPVLMSNADSERVGKAIDQIVAKRDFGVFAYGGAGTSGTAAPIQVLVYTEQVKTALAPAGLELLDIRPQVRPVK